MMITTDTAIITPEDMIIAVHLSAICVYRVMWALINFGNGTGVCYRSERYFKPVCSCSVSIKWLRHRSHKDAAEFWYSGSIDRV